MGIDNIKPPGTHGYVPSNGEGAIDPKRDVNFAAAKGKVDAPAEDAIRPGLTAIANSHKSELQDPAKLDQLVRNSVSELIDSQNISGSLSSADKKSLVDFLSQDPMFRQQMEAYLRKAVV